MTARKKKGVGFLISGGAFFVAAVVMFSTTATPAWLGTSLTIVGMIANFFGFTTVFPDAD